MLEHRRLDGVRHGFSYRLSLLYLDLAEVEELLDAHPLWSSRGPALGWLRRGDYLGDPAVPLDIAARDLVEARTGRRPLGPVRLLTQPRRFGLGFNPVSFHFCFDADEDLTALIAEVTSTPWGERCTYVVPVGDGQRGWLHTRTPKAIHVSPFLPMDVRYAWRVSVPGDRLQLQVAAERDDQRIFIAGVALRRRELTRARLVRLALTVPPSLSTRARIYRQAFALRRRGAAHYCHPGAVGAGDAA